MRRPFPIFPPLFAAFPLVALYLKNAEMVPVTDLGRPLMVSVGGSLAVWALLSIVMRGIAKGALVAGVAIGLFFTYRPFSGAVYEAPVIAPLLLICAAIPIFRTKRDLALLVRFLNVAGVLLIAIPILQRAFERSPRPASFLPIVFPVQAKRPAHRPDIYFIVLDGYGRADQLQRVMGFDNGAFLRSLRARGFFVADHARSNYCQTQLSLASTLNMSLLQESPALFPPDAVVRETLKAAMSQSFVAAYLKRQGYTTVAVTSGFHEVDFHDADLRFDRPNEFSMLESAILQLTPFETSSAVTSMFDERRSQLVGALDNLEHLARNPQSPMFVMAHILAPHPPFVFNARGQPIRQRGMPFGYEDGSDYMQQGGSAQRYRKGYTGQIQWLNRRIEALLAGIPPGAVVILMGDHGSKIGLDQGNLEKTDLRECFSNLIAILAPPSVRRLLSPSFTPVNIFRAVFDGLFGEPLPLLPGRSYYSPYPHPFRFTDVTDRLGAP